MTKSCFPKLFSPRRYRRISTSRIKKKNSSNTCVSNPFSQFILQSSSNLLAASYMICEDFSNFSWYSLPDILFPSGCLREKQMDSWIESNLIPERLLPNFEWIKLNWAWMYISGLLKEARGCIISFLAWTMFVLSTSNPHKCWAFLQPIQEILNSSFTFIPY